MGKPKDTHKTVVLPGGKKQRFNSPEQAARVKYLIGYMDQTAALHPGISMQEMSELLAADFKVAISAVLKIEQGMADRLREAEGRPKVSKSVKPGGPKNGTTE